MTARSFLYSYVNMVSALLSVLFVFHFYKNILHVLLRFNLNISPSLTSDSVT